MPRRDCEVVGVGGPGGRAGARRARRWRCCGSGSGSWSRGRWRASWRTSSCRRREPLPQALIEAVGRGERLHGDEDRLRHATGRGYVDLARLRSGAPRRRARRRRDARRRRGRCAGSLEVCAAEGIAVVPFGGGTSVVGGVEPLRGAHERLISLDLGAPARRRGRPPLADRPPRRRPARARGGGGARRARASTLGHFPQSFEYATIGGFAATRSAGQASSGYGRFDALVSSVRLLAPAGRSAHAGDAAHRRRPGAARAGRSAPRASLGVIPDVTVRVRPAPAVRRYEAWMAESFEAGAEIVRALAQGPGLPDDRSASPTRRRREGSLALSGPRGAHRQRSSTATSACAAAAAAR